MSATVAINGFGRIGRLALRAMLERHKPVADKKGKIVGVVSEADLIAKKGKQVKAIMSDKVIQITEETPVEEIARLMTAHKIRRLPVMRGKSLVGIVSRADFVGAIARGHILRSTPPCMTYKDGLVVAAQKQPDNGPPTGRPTAFTRTGYR